MSSDSPVSRGSADAAERPASRLEARRISLFGELYQVFDEKGSLIAQSSTLSRHRMQPRPPLDLGSEIRFESSGPSSFPIRIAWHKTTISGRTFILGAADPLAKYEGCSRRLRRPYCSRPPSFCSSRLLCAIWLGRRALAPVASITDDARAITESNLSARLAVPQSRDELQQLSETLNQMLERIEQSFMRTKQFTADASHELRAPMTLI